MLNQLTELLKDLLLSLVEISIIIVAVQVYLAAKFKENVNKRLMQTLKGLPGAIVIIIFLHLLFTWPLYLYTH